MLLRSTETKLRVMAEAFKAHMDLDKQIQLLIDNAPQDGVVASGGSDRTVLKLLAVAPLHSTISFKLGSKLGFDNIKQSYNPDVEKRVVYAFPTTDTSGVSAWA